MNAHHRALARIALLASASGALFGACAEGSTIENPPATSGTGGQGGGGIPPGQIGGPCEAQEDCVEGSCTQVGANKYCTVACPPPCPEGTYCGLVQGDPLCVPDLGQQCTVCNVPVDCKSPSDACLTAPPGDKFCAIDCTTMGICPNGFTCMDADVYANGGGTGGAGGAGGAGDAGGAGGAGGGNGGSGAASHPPGIPHRFCVPSNAQSCPCSKKREGVVHACFKDNAFGSCSGTETCDGQKWQGCSAETPAAEVCNGKDDNCNEQIDEGDPEALCGASPPHASWQCTAAKCEVGQCEPGWTNYPPGAPEQGCLCQQELGEPNGNCSAAAGAGSVSDAGGSISFSGTISSAQDVDFWQFDTVDSPQGNNNTYHVSIDFTAPLPNDELVMDVIRGNNCVAVPSGPGAGITSYDWCVDGVSAAGDEGEAGCGPQAARHCANHSSKYYVRVYRKPGVTGTCAQYTITVTATGGDACDFTQKCQ